MAEVLKKVKPQLGTEEMRIIARFLLRSLNMNWQSSLPNATGCRTRKIRERLEDGREGPDTLQKG